MKKVTALLLAAVMCFALAACGESSSSSAAPAEAKSEAPAASETKSETPAQAETETKSEAPVATETKSEEPAATAELNSYKFCGDIVGQGVPVLDDIVNEEIHSFEALGSTFQIYNDSFTSDTQSTNVQTMASSGADGMTIFGWNATLYKQINEISARTSMPYVIFDQIPLDMTVVDELNQNEYYVGSVGIDNYKGAEGVAQEMIDAGITKALILGGAVGDVVQDARADGFTTKFEELGGTIVGVARCTDPSEATTKMDDLLAGNADAEAVYAQSGDYAISALQALDNYSGRELKIYSCDSTLDTIPYILDGSIVRGDSGSKLINIIASTLLYNYVNGNPIKDDEGNAPYLHDIVAMPIYADNAQEFADKFYTGHPLSDEQLQAFVQPGVTYQTYLDFFDGLTIDDLEGSN